ncbi:hypothetical protein BC829DRAFT_297653 [Chytridium lagenaria]|nr:hypothetical protein BC829DRAFT_297653 [Chytridium lagenaria]
MKQPAPGLSPALKDWITLVMKKDLLLSKEDEPAILSDDGTISDEKVNGFTQRKQLESLMTDVIDAILLPKDGMSAAFRSPGEAAISPDLLHHQVKPTWVKDLNVLVEEWIKQPSWRCEECGNCRKGVSSVPKPLDIEIFGRWRGGRSVRKRNCLLTMVLSESSQKEEELCECCSKVKTRHHHHPLAFHPLSNHLFETRQTIFVPS